MENLTRVIDMWCLARTMKSLTKTIMFLYFIFFASLIIILVVGIYGVVASLIQGVEVVGLALVNIEFPPINVFPIMYWKPVTWLYVALVTLFISSLELQKERIAKITPSTRSISKIICFVLGCMALYEVFFNFTLWSGLIAADAILGRLNPDVIINPFPNPESPWSVVFATKMFVVLAIVSFYFLFCINRLEDKSRS